jgi:aspartyl/asparaginyl beta-hydroxylase (cupin superfamily)
MTLAPGTVTPRLPPPRPPLALKKKIKFAGAAFGALIFAAIFPKLTLFYATCGLYDVTRNRPLDGSLLRQYFLGNGVTTWLLSPLNILLDLLTLPYRNRGVYRLEDLPEAYRAEVERVIEVAKREKIAGQLEARTKELDRSMIFFKWYGENVDTFLDTPAFHERWNYIQTIGVSVFNRKISTSRHFGPIRPTLRVLYNLNDSDDRSAYIVVGDKVNYWKDSKLFIFDDTLLHQSFNNSDNLRYCLFVDIVRPSLFPGLLRFLVRIVHTFFQSANSIFYKKWKIIR